MWSGREAVRFVAVIASQLPAGSRVHQAASNNAAWTATDHLIALVADEIKALNHLTQVVNTDEKHRRQIPEVEFVPRPPEIAEREAEAARIEAAREAAAAPFRAQALEAREKMREAARNGT